MINKTLSQRAWEWIQQQQDFGSAGLAEHMDVSLNTAQKVINYLREFNVIENVTPGTNPAIYQKVEGAKAFFSGKSKKSPKPNSARQKLWQAMRFLRDFTISDLVATAESSETSAHVFVGDLVRTGYVIATRPLPRRATRAERKGFQVRYRLIKNTGHKYPVRRPNGLYDQNLKTLVERNKSANSETQKELNNELA